MLPRVIVWAIVAAALVHGCRREPEAAQSFTTQAKQNFSTGKEAADAFVDRLFKNPDQAYELVEADYRKGCSRSQFRQGLSILLPPAKTITSVKYLEREDDWQGADGRTFSAFYYEVRSTDDFQARSKLGVNVLKSKDGYEVRRITVSAIAP